MRGRRAVQHAFATLGVRCDETVTSRPGHAAQVAAAGGVDADAVFVLGGDGTVMEVVGALADTNTPVGVLPGGTGNLVARMLGIPLDLREAVRALVHGSPRHLDLVRLAPELHFTFAAGVGIDADMILRTTVMAKRRLGVLGYTLAAARSAFEFDAFDALVEIDGRAFREQATLVMVANGGALFGGAFLLGPDIYPDDGMLDVCVFSTPTWQDLASVLWRVVRRDFSPHPRMRFERGRHVRITTTPPRIVEADGELVSETPVEMRIRPLAATFLQPRR